MTRQVGATWVGVHETPYLYTNQVAVQLGLPAGLPAVPDGIHLVFGQAQQPLLTGSPEEVAAAAEKVNSIPIVALARLVMSRERAAELRDLLAQAVERFDQAVAEGHA